MTATSQNADPPKVLVAVRRARHADLLTSLMSVKAAISGLVDIDGTLAARVTDRLDGAWRDCRDGLTQVETASNEDVWRLLVESREAIHRLAQETLAYTQGALVRQSGADGGFCKLADRLLDHFGNQERQLNWRGFTIVAESAFLGDLAEVVRMSYPRTSFWHLPVAAHEFGHFAAPGIRVEERNGSFRGTVYPVADFLRERWDDHDQQGWFHAHEYVADIFATFALGAAYPYYLLSLEVSPDSLRASVFTHPSWNNRMWVVFEILERLVPHGAVTAPVVADVRSRWQHLVEASAGTKEPDGTSLLVYVEYLLPLLQRYLRGLRYESFGQAQQLAVALRRDKQAVLAATAPDVLNAAWLARMDDDTDPDAIAARALKLL